MTIFFYDYHSYEALFNGCCKDNASREQRCKLACKLCRGAAYLMQRYKLIRYNKKTFLVIMAKEIKINIRLIIDGKEQGCDLLKIHYLCGDKDNTLRTLLLSLSVVICSKFITFAVTKTTMCRNISIKFRL